MPYVTLREGEEGAPDNLIISPEWPSRRPRLRYADEERDDRDVRGVLWARCSHTPRDSRGMPTGKPRWKFMHPSRQRETMQELRCQVCVRPARTPCGFIFLAGPDDYGPDETSIITGQPPVCAKHARAAARLCPHLDGRPMVFVALSAPLYGVLGTLYGYAEHGVQVLATPDRPLPYGHGNLPTFLASQLVRRLGSFRLVDLEELLEELTAAAP
ncbi:hypothetical protein [Streptomyces sp. PSKA30]|uniref:hypothetical protein n=1 Tax=Streptomyces sp. PSKA30 TaxID=2874597 RepID=UPI001CD18172|nr:hypothetical protein [Streptomyces sp. PSKA30]MBZ9641507.1 hypothetical protein [Streptomyces sp. PSKA30]